ncbi:MAG: hypothetical protein ACE5F7_03940 [Nitrospiria bacterium]
MNEETLDFFQGEDRRSLSVLNRFRRFLNDYWLIPVLICYLQLATQVIYPADTPLERLTKGNQAFFKGVPIAYQIVTHEFPFAILGHFYELGMQGLYKTNLLQVPHTDIKKALAPLHVQQKLYDQLVASRSHHDSEIGGLLSISYKHYRPTLRLYEIPSLNEVYLKQLRGKRESPRDFVKFISSEESAEIFEGVGIHPEWVRSATRLIQNRRVSESVQRTTIENFIDMYEALSESRYILSPYQFKAGIGKIPFEEQFVGIFHFHNGLNEPPSDTDIQQSLRNRQLVFTFSESGWTLYDVDKQNMRKVDINIDNRVALQ